MVLSCYHSWVRGRISRFLAASVASKVAGTREEHDVAILEDMRM